MKPIDTTKIQDISVHSSTVGVIQPEDVTIREISDEVTEIIVGEGTVSQVRRITTDNPDLMLKHAARHMKIAANFMAVAEVLRQQEDTEKDKSRKAVLVEFGFGYSDRFEDYTPAIRNLIDNLIQTRKEAEELSKEEPPRVKRTFQPLPMAPRGTYKAYCFGVFGDNPPESAIKTVYVAGGRVYTFNPNVDITDHFYTGKDWVLLK